MIVGVGETAAALFVLVERDTSPWSDAHFLASQKESAETEDRIAAGCRLFNGNVCELNSL